VNSLKCGLCGPRVLAPRVLVPRVLEPRVFAPRCRSRVPKSHRRINISLRRVERGGF
jgi:hypothetical protein